MKITGEKEKKSEEILQNLSFNVENDPLIHTEARPEAPLTETTIIEPKPVLRIPKKREISVEKPLKMRVFKVKSRAEELETMGMKYHWELETAFRRYLQQRLIEVKNSDILLENRVSEIEEFRRNAEKTRENSGKLEDEKEMEGRKREEVCGVLKEEMRFGEEVHQAEEILKRKERIAKKGNWLQSQIQRDKDKLQKGVGRFVRTGASQ